MKKLLPFLLAILLAFTFVSCDEPELPDFTVTFDGIEHAPVKVAGGEKFSLPDDLPVKSDYKLVIKMGDTVLVPGEKYEIAADTVLICSWEKLPVEVSGIVLDSGNLELRKGGTAQLNAEVTPLDADDRTVSWTSADPKVASVDASGLVTGVGKGETVITAEAGGKSAVCSVKVHESLKVPADILSSGELENSVTDIFMDFFGLRETWNAMHVYEGYALSLNSAEEKAALFESVKKRVEEGVENSSMTVSEVDGSVVFSAVVELDPSEPPVSIVLTDTPDGEWTFAVSYEDGGKVLNEYFFAEDSDGRVMSRFSETVDGKEYSYRWEYIDASQLRPGAQVFEEKMYYSEGSHEIFKAFNVPDLRLAESGTVIRSSELYDVEGKLEYSSESIIRRAAGSDLIVIEDPASVILFWAGEGPMPIPDAIAAPIPEVLLDMIRSEATPEGTWDMYSSGLIVDIDDPAEYVIYGFSEDRTPEEWSRLLSGSGLQGSFPVYYFSDFDGKVIFREDFDKVFSVFIYYEAEVYKAAFDELFGKNV